MLPRQHVRFNFAVVEMVHVFWVVWLLFTCCLALIQRMPGGVIVLFHPRGSATRRVAGPTTARPAVKRTPDPTSSLVMFVAASRLSRLVRMVIAQSAAALRTAPCNTPRSTTTSGASSGFRLVLEASSAFIIRRHPARQANGLGNFMLVLT